MARVRAPKSKRPAPQPRGLVQGDCLAVLRDLPDGCIDLIYIDPPFFTGRNHRGLSKAHSFSDVWDGGLEQYLDWLVERLVEMRRVLRATGAIYIHLDSRASHHVKVRCDRIFGARNFRNEIHWRRDAAGKGAKATSGQWPRNVDNILVYSKGPVWHFSQAHAPLNARQVANYRRTDRLGRRFRMVQLGDYSASAIRRLARQGLISTSSSGKKYKKYFLDEARATIDTLWTDIPGYGTRTASREWLGYPTQKPEALLERIIRASSKRGALVADFFCGSGTTCAVAKRLGRKWLGVDVSASAVRVARKRLA